jgi:aquaporin Z
VTLTYARLGKIEPWDALFYTSSQFAGGLLGVLLATLAMGMAIRNPAVNYAATQPGPGGAWAAFLGEATISFILMLVVLTLSNNRRLARFTGLAAGLMVATFISFEAPISGMSMNPARTLASALPAGAFTALWVYFTAPPLGMLLAARLHTGLKGARGVICAKLNHGQAVRCIFRCGY